ncbi:hypothetical protein KCU88_g3418, partial [Aureobasidium melanogenum]
MATLLLASLDEDQKHPPPTPSPSPTASIRTFTVLATIQRIYSIIPYDEGLPPQSEARLSLFAVIKPFARAYPQRINPPSHRPNTTSGFLTPGTSVFDAAGAHRGMVDIWQPPVQLYKGLPGMSQPWNRKAIGRIHSNVGSSIPKLYPLGHPSCSHQQLLFNCP